MKTKTEVYKTILVISLGFLALYLLFRTNLFLHVALVISVLSVLSEGIANRIAGVWLKLATLLSYIVPNIILSLVFFCLLTPIALLQKLFKKNTAFGLSNKLKSTFVDSNKSIDKTHFEKPW